MNTRALLFFLSLPVVACLLLSCGECSKKLDCPGYNDTLLNNLFAYANNQQLLFKNAAGETVSFTLNNTETTQAYRATSGALGPGPYCEAKKAFASEEKDTAGRTLFTLSLNSSGDNHFASLVLFQNALYFSALADTGFYDISINGANTPLVRMPSVTIGNRNFTNVITAARDTNSTKTGGIYKIWYNKTEGLVGYAEYPSLKTW